MSGLSFMTVALYLDEVMKNSAKPDQNRMANIYKSIFQDIQKAGYQWVDLSSWEVDALGVKCMLQLLQKHELKVSSYIFFEDFAELEKDLSGGVQKAYAGVDQAALLGSEFLMIGIQDRGNISETDPVKIREMLAAYFNGICEYAKGKKVRPVIENIPDAGLSLCRWEDVRAAMDEVPLLGYIFDSGTLLVAEENSEDYISALKDRLVYVHLKDMKETDTMQPGVFASASGKLLINAPTGKGLVDMRTVLKQLAKAGYQGRLSVEFCPDEDLPLYDSIIRSRQYIGKMALKNGLIKA